MIQAGTFLAANAGTIAAVAATATVVGTMSQINAQKRQAAAQRQQQQVIARRSQRQAVREAQIRRAQAQAQAGALGVTGGSALGGGFSSLSSQLGSSIGTSTQLSGLSNRISMAGQSAATAGAIAGLGSSVFSAVDGFGAMGFGKKSTATPSIFGLLKS